MSNDNVTIETPSGTITIEPRQWGRDSLFRFQIRPRISVWGDRNTESIIENLNNRTRRPHAEYKKHALRILAEAGINFDGKNMRWNQYAYCSCPCSPAFVAPKQVLTYNETNYYNYDLSITIRDLGNVDYTKQGRLWNDGDTPLTLEQVLIP